MRTLPPRSALPAALCALALLPASAAAQTGYDPALAVSPSRFTTADAITVTWRRPAAPTKDDVWSLCPAAGGACVPGAGPEASAAFGGLAEGRYVFALQTEGTGLFYKGLVDIAIDRTAPGVPTVADWRIPPVGGGIMRPVVLPGEAQNAPVVAVRWTRCTHAPQTTAGTCIDGRSAPTDVAIPIDPAPLDACGTPTASFSASLWLVDAAGNENPAAAATVAPALPAVGCAPPQTQQPPSPPAPPPVVRRAVRLKVSGTLRGSATRRRGRMTVALTPRTATGSVALRVTPRRGRQRLRSMRETATVRRGRVTWTGRLPTRTTSLSVRASYAGDARHAAAKRTVVVRQAKR
ncbi:hypothetical protein [Patulibacter americanus]|uniref:hypothetical protein n=1 Tax=Patulibacter americanus TaxID=588672 RepID=UPI0003B71F99|nr:hypothetical protein [Patulibacter americanus]